MEKVEKAVEDTVNSSAEKAEGFIEHMGRFDDDTKTQLMNMIQYLLISLFPIILLTKLNSKLIPDVDESKQSYEIIFEILGQSLLLLFGMLTIHRFTTYFPTYSEEKYKNFHPIKIILPFFVILISLQTKLGDKVRLVFDRHLGHLFESAPIEQKKPSNPVKVLQPLTQPLPTQPLPTHQVSRADYVAESENLNLNTHQNRMNEVHSQKEAQYIAQFGGHSENSGNSNESNNEGFVNDPQSLALGMNGGQEAMGMGMGMQEPMAANEALGGFSGF